MDSNDTDDTNVIGKDIILVSILGGIGEASNFLDIIADGVLNAGALGNIFIHEVVGLSLIHI